MTTPASAQILAKLGSQLRDEGLADEDGPGFTDLGLVAGEVGRLCWHHDEEAIRKLLPQIAVLREALEERKYAGLVPVSPWEILKANDLQIAIPYVAGALWALASSMEAYVERFHEEAQRRRDRSERAWLRALIVEELAERGSLRPGDILATASPEGGGLSRSQISKALGDLMDEGRVAPADPPEGTTDRRARYYKLVESL